MVVANHRLQCLECDICQETTYVSPRGFEDAEKRMLLREKVAAEHKDCEQYRNNPELAKTFRKFRNNLAAETRRDADRKRSRTKWPR